MPTFKEFSAPEGTIKVTYGENGKVLGMELEPDPNYQPPETEEQGPYFVGQKTLARVLGVEEAWVRKMFDLGELKGEDLDIGLFINVDSFELLTEVEG